MPAGEPTKRSVDTLKELYSVVVGMALVGAIGSVLEKSSATAISIQWVRLPWFGAFFVTLLPFYHGALRYLDNTYIFAEKAPKRWALLIDYLLLFSEACFLVVLGLVVVSPPAFRWVFAALLALDVIWAIAGYFATETGIKTSHRWLLINACALVLWAVFKFTPVLEGARPYDLVGLACARSVADYVLCWSVFFPEWGKA